MKYKPLPKKTIPKKKKRKERWGGTGEITHLHPVYTSTVKN